MGRLPVLAFGLVLLGSLTPAASFAQDTRSYVYQEFDASYAVQRNATVEVEETLTYDFHGSYHQGYRSIPHAGSDSITDVRLYDGTTGQSLAYSSKTLDKTDPASWGKYTVYTQNGATNVEWYYDLADTTHTWKLSYTLHGAVSFYTSHDEFYWNIFSDLDAPVARVRATVVLPAANTEPSSRWYLADSGHEEQIQQANDRTTVFTASSIGSHAPATIALGWQKGLVSKQAYWRDWLSTRWPYLLSALIVLGTLLFCIGYWFMTERYPRIGEVIVPEYAPPRGLPPLEAELVVRESLSSRAWPATIVDLAVRGHLEITELPHKWFYFGSKYYELRRKEGGVDTQRDYEKEFLGVLFDPEYATDGVFSTLELSRSISDKREIYAAMKKLEKKALAETDADTNAFAHTLAGQQKGKVALLAILPILVFALIFVSSNVGSSSFGYLFLVACSIGSYALIRYFTRYEARLSSDGEQLRKEILGFKLYLKTAERYRLQNLTPDMFEKFLPYAMIFKIEKQWAKAFDGMTVAPPNWYAASYVAGSTPSPSFSASSFASSFSASFTSSFASTGGSGASGGGGAAGGGGGGGGGGAS